MLDTCRQAGVNQLAIVAALARSYCAAMEGRNDLTVRWIVKFQDVKHG
jgi:hypothetical protein